VVVEVGAADEMQALIAAGKRLGLRDGDCFTDVAPASAAPVIHRVTMSEPALRLREVVSRG
jgi:hypothetical protein